MPSSLHGRIVYRFQLPLPEADICTKRNTTSAAPSVTSGRTSRTPSEHDYTSCGFIFIPDDELHFYKEYLLSVPKNLTTLACDAVRRDLKVVIQKYAEIPFTRNGTKFNESGNELTQQVSPTPYSVIEVHELDIYPDAFPSEKIEEERKSGENAPSERNTEFQNLWTPTQIWRKEQLDFRKMKNSRSKFSLLAKVSAISPIIALDQSHPFALVKIHDEQNPDVTCVVVLHGNSAMLNHEVIHPLNTFVFHDVVYKPWAVHKSLLYGKKDVKDSTSSKLNFQLSGLIPSYVFVATGADCVSKYYRSRSHRSRDPSQSERAKRGMTPALSFIPLETSIFGIIDHVETSSTRSGCRISTVIRYLDIILMDKSNSGFSEDDHNFVTDKSPIIPKAHTRCRLYLSHFPMSVALQCSLRREGIIQAHNIHLLCSHDKFCFRFGFDDTIKCSYGASLRSTLSLLKHSISPTRIKNDALMETRTETETSIEDDAIAAKRKFSEDQSILLGTSIQANFSGLHENWDQVNIGLSTCSKIDDADSKNYQSIALSPTFTNYRFRRMNRTYQEEMYFDHVMDWEHQNFQDSLLAVKSHVPRPWIVQTLLTTNRNDWTAKKDINHHSGGENSEMNHNSLKTHQRTSVRNPYAEFFEPVPFMKDDGIDFQSKLSPCHLSVKDQKYLSCSSEMLGLNDIRIASQCFFENFISQHLLSPKTCQDEESSYKLQKGFHGSIRAPFRMLYANPGKDYHVRKFFEGNEENVNDSFGFVGGFVSETHTTIASVASIKDGICQIPISCDKNICNANINDFAMGQVDSVMISSLCLEIPSITNNIDQKESDTRILNSQSISKSESLPALNSKNDDLYGNCSLVNIRGYLFLTAVQINCSEFRLHKVTKSSGKFEEDVMLEDVVLSVDKCLATKKLLSESLKSASLMGMLTRCRIHRDFYFDGSYRCCRLTVSSLKGSDSDDLKSDNSCLQALNLTVSIIQDAATMAAFKKKVDVVWHDSILIESQRILGFCFWVLGQSGRTCAITFGGSEDITPGSSCSRSITKVIFPISSLQFNKLGYTRSTCSYDCLDAFFENPCHPFENSQRENASTKTAGIQSFDFLSDAGVIPGMLHRRPSRRYVFRTDSPFRRSVGELLTKPSKAIPTSTVFELFELVFQELRRENESQRIINPSLVRRISKGRIVNLSFCQVQCYCTKCCCPLVNFTSNVVDEDAGSLKRKRAYSFHEPSFWHLPRPEKQSMGFHKISNLKATIADCTTATLPEHLRITKLRCPKNNCSKQMFGVKWECSGVLDDGTGQATLYANGDAALTLLGMSGETLQIIEKGVWSMSDGNIQFMKSVPPPQDLREKVVNIRSRQRTYRRNESAMVDPKRLLSDGDLAIYLLDRHCRSSDRPRCRRDYYVRCKALMNRSKGISFVHHTKIDSFFEDFGNKNNKTTTIYRGQVASYTVPSLKLELVDCGVCSFESFDTKF